MKLQFRSSCLAVLLICLAIPLSAIVENSIIPAMEYYENIENLSPNKYSKQQFQEIKKALGQKCNRIRVASYNMLFNIFDQNVDPVNRWPERLPRIVELLADMNADVIGTQELEPDQVQDLLPFLESTYEFVSINSNTGEQDGIFFKKERFHLLKKKVTVIHPSEATLTVIQLKDRKTHKSLAIANTHFAFSNIEHRTLQAHFVAKKVRSIVKKMPVIFMGDLNTFPNQPDMAFPALDGDYVNKILTKNTLKDSIDVSYAGHVGPIATFTNNPPSILPFQGTGTPGVFLDHIYVSRGIQVLLHAVQPGTVNGHFPSDHMPVVIDVVQK